MDYSLLLLSINLETLLLTQISLSGFVACLLRFRVGISPMFLSYLCLLCLENMAAILQCLLLDAFNRFGWKQWLLSYPSCSTDSSSALYPILSHRDQILSKLNKFNSYWETYVCAKKEITSVNKTCKFLKQIQINKGDQKNYSNKRKELELVENAVEMPQNLIINKLFKDYQLVE